MRDSTRVLVLGSGSNLLFARDFGGLVVRCRFKEIEVSSLGGGKVEVAAGAGLPWDWIVRYCVHRGWSGLENLSLIPGSVGAAPIQNIGAYGVEISSCFSWLEALDLQSGELHRMGPAECCFSYRDSRFKSDWKDRFLVLRVAFRLGGQLPVTDYPSLQAELSRAGITKPTATSIRRAVIAIRQRRLPDPARVGNAGSFFKNPVVDAERLSMLRKEWPELPAFETGDGHYRVAAGWLVESCGWKGIQRGSVGVSEDHALVLINCGSAQGHEILALATEIELSVKARFNLRLEREVRVIS